MTESASSSALRAPSSGSSRFLPLLLLLFVGSGCSALVYEVVWLQLLQLVIGSTAVSMGVLLGTFMGGMCLGSWLLPRAVSARRHPLRVYAALELGIGAIALVVLHAMPHVERLYAEAAGGGWAMSLALRAAVSAACLLPPTVLMGATLPAISRWIQTSREGVAWLGFFYGGNIVGAVAGCLLAGFYLLRVHDVAVATYSAFAVNVLVSLVGLTLAGRAKYSPPVSAARAADLLPAGAEGASPSANRGLGASPRPATPPAGSGAWEKRRTVPISSAGNGDSPRSQAKGACPSRGVYLVIALSGFTALGAEVVWTRLLSLLLGGTVYTFSLILAAFLLGLGIGSAIGSALTRRPADGVGRPGPVEGQARARLGLGACQLLLGGALAWAAWMMTRSLPFWPVNPDLTFSPWFTFQVDLVRCLWTVLPGAILWGASFPLALAAAAGEGQDPGRLVGGVYAANTIGAILGALAFSLVLVPALGTRGSQRALLAVAGLSAVIALWPRRGTAALSTLGLAAALVAAPLLAWTVKDMPWGVVAFGRHCATWVQDLYPGVVDEKSIDLLMEADSRRFVLRASGDRIEFDPRASGEAGRLWRKALEANMAAWVDAHRADLLTALRAERWLPGEGMTSSASGGGSPHRYCLMVEEGTNVSVAVTETLDGHRYFHGAGKVQASTDPRDMRLQRMLGHIPMLSRRDPGSVRSVLVVACGAGVTAGAFVPYDTVERIVICDIEKMVPKRVAPLFAEENYGVVADPRTQVIEDDGRHFLRTTREKFDIITSDPIDPWVKGCAALNTVEYYRLCKERLNPGGVVALWLPLYGSSIESTKSAIATFFQVFPNGVIWSNDSSGSGYDIVLFAQTKPAGPIDLDRLQDWLEAHPKVKASLEQVGFGARRESAGQLAAAPEVAVDLLATYAGQAQDLAEWTRGAEINTDRNLRLQYLAGWAVNANLSERIFSDILWHYRFPVNLVTGSAPRLLALQKLLEETGRKSSLAP